MVERDDGKWPQSSDDTGWQRLLALAGPLDNEAAKRELGVDVEAALAGPRYTLEEARARCARRFLQIEEDFCCLCREPKKYLIDTCIGRECASCWCGSQAVTDGMDRAWMHATGVRLITALTERPSIDEIVEHRTSLREVE